MQMQMSIAKNEDSKAAFGNFFAAKVWAQKNAKDCCLPFQYWMVQKEEGQFVVAIKSKNDNKMCGYAN